MEFRLIYSGPLRSGQSDKNGSGLAEHKHRLRKHFHAQMRELWKQHPDLRQQSVGRFLRHTTPSNMVSAPGPNVTVIQKLTELEPGGKSWVQYIADDHQYCGGRFVPLVSEKGGFTCSLSILFLRRDAPGSLVSSNGDIDNRIKVLLDGLQMPTDPSQLGGISLDPTDEDPFFCLLEDDKLITGLTVTTDRLIAPKGPHEAIADVHLVIHVRVKNPSSIFAGGRLV